MKNSDFFEQQTMSSKVKARIVSEYFPQYASIIVNRHMPKTIRYIDLFAGPGRYEDGNASTPILIGRKCKDSAMLKSKVSLLFNDCEYADTLKQNFESEFPTGTFVNEPFFANRVVGENAKITDFLTRNTHEGKHNEAPSLLFIDPFGYKGVQTTVLSEFLKNWGNEIFIFVNIKRIHAAIENDKFEELMYNWFPSSFIELKNDRVFKSTVPERLQLIIDRLGNEYQKILGGTVYYTAFKFQEEDSEATSHYILHLTKGKRGFDLIKTIYNDFANVGTIFDGVNTYTFDVKKILNPMHELFDTKSENIDQLKAELIKTYKGRGIIAKDLYEEHQIKGLYCYSHYTEALRRLHEEGHLSATYCDNKNHKVPVLISKYCHIKFN